MRMPSFPTEPGWCIYGLDSETFGEPFVLSSGFSRRARHGTWRTDRTTLHYGDIHNLNTPYRQVTSTPHYGEHALRALHTGLGLAGFVYGMSGTGHISGAPVPPERITVHLDDVPVEAEAWRGQSAEVAWIETDDTWIVLFASKATLADTRLTRLDDLNPLLESSSRRFGHRGP